jgi:hypothetical protein
VTEDVLAAARPAARGQSVTQIARELGVGPVDAVSGAGGQRPTRQPGRHGNELAAGGVARPWTSEADPASEAVQVRIELSQAREQHASYAGRLREDLAASARAARRRARGTHGRPGGGAHRPAAGRSRRDMGAELLTLLRQRNDPA